MTLKKGSEKIEKGVDIVVANIYTLYCSYELEIKLIKQTVSAFQYPDRVCKTHIEKDFRKLLTIKKRLYILFIAGPLKRT